MNEIERILKDELSRAYGDARIRDIVVGHILSLVRKESDMSFHRGWQEGLDYATRR